MHERTSRFARARTTIRAQRIGGRMIALGCAKSRRLDISPFRLVQTKGVAQTAELTASQIQRRQLDDNLPSEQPR